MRRASTNPSSSAASVLGLRVRRVELRSGSIAYVDEGAGPTVVLLHGAPVTSLGFVRVIHALRARHRVIAPDLPGFGQSRAGAGFDGSLAGYARSVEELCGALELEGLVMFGFDASGSIALAAATRMASRVVGLVIADTVPIPLTGRAWFVKMILRHVVSSRVVRWFNRWLNLLPWLVVTVDPLRRRFSADERAVLTGQYDSARKRERILDMFAAMGHDDEFMQRTAVDAARGLADKPVLLLFGRLDPVRLFGGVARYQRMFPRATVHIIPGERHFPILAAGEAVAAAIEGWLRPAIARASRGAA